MHDLPERLEAQLQERQPRVHTEWEARPAAVLVPLYQHRGDWHLLYTRRTETVESHRGQVSFPGGAIEADDASPRQAALREAEEEIGLPASQARVLGQMDPLLTVTQFLVTPFVAVIPWPFELRLNHHEVASAFGIPLDWLMDSDNLEVKKRQPAVPGPPIPVFYFEPYGGEVVWGVTARITVELLNLIASLGLK